MKVEAKDKFKDEIARLRIANKILKKKCKHLQLGNSADIRLSVLAIMAEDAWERFYAMERRFLKEYPALAKELGLGQSALEAWRDYGS